MRPNRWLLYAGIVLTSLLLAVMARDIARDLLIIPLAYLAWQAGLLYWAVPQLVKWALVVLMFGIGVIWQLVPEFGRSANRRPPETLPHGQVETLALWIHRASGSNYFKWQVANRVGRIARKLDELSGRRAAERSPAVPVQEYLSAGLDHSFVDFPSPRRPFQRRIQTPLDLPPVAVVEYMEAQMEEVSGKHTQSH